MRNDKRLTALKERHRRPAHLPARLGDSGLYLVDPGGVRVMWEVWAPTSELDRMALAGDYDIVTDHNYAKPKGSDNTLFGGLNDSVALVLVAPNVNAVRASTRLTLTAH